MEDNSDVTMVALKAHPGYNYNGKASLYFVTEGETFTTTAARAARLIAKGTAAKATVEPVAAPQKAEVPEVKATPAPKVDGRTKAGKAARHK